MTDSKVYYASTTDRYWTIVWDYIGGDCGDLPWICWTESEANALGEDWVFETVNDMKAEPDMPEEGGEGWPIYHVVRHDPPTYPLWKQGARWICDGPEGRFHAKTKTEAIRLLRGAAGKHD
jgi:hypothetical protein